MEPTEPTVKRIPDDPQVQILDEDGRTIGVITRPIELEVLGPGREKVYLSRRPTERTSHAA
jgi:hypothetical protein